MLWLLVEVDTNINILSQHRRTAASSVSVVLGIANILKYLIELRARTLSIVRVLAYIYRLRKNLIN